MTYIVLRAEDQYLHGSGTGGAITTENGSHRRIDPGLLSASINISVSLTPIIEARLSLFNSLLDVLNPIVASSNSAPNQLLQTSTQSCIVAFNSSFKFHGFKDLIVELVK